MHTRRELLALVVPLALGVAHTLGAQGVTTGAFSGLVTDAQARPIHSAQVQVVNRATGFSTATLTREGRFLVQGLEVGGPYTITVRRIGFRPESREGLYVALGQNLPVNFQLQEQAAQLAEVTITATEDPRFSPNRMGAGALISDSALRRLPTLNRNFTDFVATAPQVTTAGPGNSGGGVNNRYNQIQIDGATETDIFGLGSTGQPGGQARGKSISLEAVKEYQVLLSPYDVRQGNFAGFLVNAVTKSGTNRLQATGIFSTRNEGLARDVELIRNSKYEQSQYGGSIGGPIVKDRVHFFVAGELQTRNQPAIGPYVGQSSSSAQPLPTSEAEINRFISILQTKYGFDAGSPGKISNENPLRNAFARVDVQLAPNHRLVLRDNYGYAEDQIFSRSTSNQGVVSFDLTSARYRFKSSKNAPLAQLFSNFSNGANNELFVGYNRIRDERRPDVIAPFVQVTVGQSNFLRAGSEQFSQGNSLDQDIFEVTDNFTYPIGRHSITVGTKNEFYKIRNLFTESAYGVYTFRSLDSLEAGNPSSYRLSFDLATGKPAIDPTPNIEARFKAAMLGVYAQDRWEVTPRLTITGGVRVDMPRVFDTPGQSAVVQQVFGRNTSEIPDKITQVSPRIGFNYNLGSVTAPSQLRGGVGLFVGRPPFVWIANSFTNSGVNVGFLNCSATAGGGAPTFVADPNNQPTACRNGQGIATGVVGPVNLMSSDLKFPQTLRASLGYDRQLFWGLVGTIEGLYTKGMNNLFYTNINLVGSFDANGDGRIDNDQTGTLLRDRNGRVVYADTIRTNAVAVPVLRDRRFTEAIDVTNQSKDYSFNITGQLEKRFSHGIEGRAAYTYSRARDVQSLGSSRAISNWRFGRTYGGRQTDQTVGISIFDQPHKVSLSGTYTFPWQTWKTDLSVIYAGTSGQPHDYVYAGTGGRGDLNGDSQQGNDLIYVPKSASDLNEIRFSQFIKTVPVRDTVTVAEQQAAFEKFIQGSDCLRGQRGAILERNSCREPWKNFLNVSVRQSLPSIQRHTLALQMDIFNFLNLLNKDWGSNWRVPGSNSNEPLLTHAGQTAGPLTSSQGIFQFDPAYQRYNKNNIDSYYQIQLQVRYSF